MARVARRLVASGDEPQIALSSVCHIGEVVADFELQQRNWTQVAIPFIVPVNVPSHRPLHQVCAVFNDGIGCMMVRHFVQQSCDVR